MVLFIMKSLEFPQTQQKQQCHSLAIMYQLKSNQQALRSFQNYQTGKSDLNPTKAAPQDAY